MTLRGRIKRASKWTLLVAIYLSPFVFIGILWKVITLDAYAMRSDYGETAILNGPRPDALAWLLAEQDTFEVPAILRTEFSNIYRLRMGTLLAIYFYPELPADRQRILHNLEKQGCDERVESCDMYRRLTRTLDYYRAHASEPMMGWTEKWAKAQWEAS